VPSQLGELVASTCKSGDFILNKTKQNKKQKNEAGGDGVVVYDCNSSIQEMGAEGSP
jgi:hypothetical protein